MLTADEDYPSPLLTPDEIVLLAQRIEVGEAAGSQLWPAGQFARAKTQELRDAAQEGKDARRILTKAHLRLVGWIANQYRASGLPSVDLITAGYDGLERAIRTFDWRQEIDFWTHATVLIRERIAGRIANPDGMIRLPDDLPDDLVDIVFEVQQARSQLELRLGRRATAVELALEAEMSEDAVTEALLYLDQTRSLDEFNEDGDPELDEVVVYPLTESQFDDGAKAWFDGVLADLAEQEREILMARFGFDRGEPRNLEEVAEYSNLPPEQVRQIETRALSKLRDSADGIRAREVLGY